MKPTISLKEWLITWGWAILIIVAMMWALVKMDVFSSSDDYKLSCKMLCEQDGLDYDTWEELGGCKVCKCTTFKQLTCED